MDSHDTLAWVRRDDLRELERSPRGLSVDDVQGHSFGIVSRAGTQRVWKTLLGDSIGMVPRDVPAFCGRGASPEKRISDLGLSLESKFLYVKMMRFGEVLDQVARGKVVRLQKQGRTISEVKKFSDEDLDSV